MESPVESIQSNGAEVKLQAIDHLPSLLPMESSVEYSDALTPYLIDLLNEDGSYQTTWVGAENIFSEKTKELLG